jgi:hypothetical protein
MAKPKLCVLLERTDINPLHCFGDCTTLRQVVNGLQQLGREAIGWMVEAKWRSQLIGDRSLWDWEDPCTLHPLLSLLGGYQPLQYSPHLSPCSSITELSEPSSPTDSIVSIPPNSPTSTPLPFETDEERLRRTQEEDVELLLQVILHPTAS